MKRGVVALLAVACLTAQALHGQAPPAGAAADFVAPGPVVPLAPNVMTAMSAITTSVMAAHVRFLASPALEGRGLGARGLDGAAEYAAAALAIAGVEPVPQAGGGLASAPYFHPVPLREISGRGGRLTVGRRTGDVAESWTFAAGADVVLPELPPGAFSAPVVFAGHGIRETSPPRDDYRDLDVAGRMVLVEDGVPAGDGWQRPEAVARWASADADERHAARQALAHALGARAVLVIEREGFAESVAATAASPAPPSYLAFDAAEGPAATPIIRVSARVGRSLLSEGGSDGGRGAQPRALAGVVAEVEATGSERVIVSRNVLGVVRGSDPRLRDEAVVVGAHLDHLGSRGGVLHPGADDNATGVAALLEIAKTLASAPSRPKRSVVVAFWTGEEEGHLGSEHYAANPAWPLAKTSAYLNLDMIGHPWTAREIDTLVTGARLPNRAAFLAAANPANFIEVGVAESAPQLGPVLAQAARAAGLALHLDWTRGTSGGSDYRAFARKGVPFVRFFGNYFDGYHEPIDTPDRVDTEQAATIARLALASAWLLADR